MRAFGVSLSVVVLTLLIGSITWLGSLIYLSYEGFQHLQYKGVFCEVAGSVILFLFVLRVGYSSLQDSEFIAKQTSKTGKYLNVAFLMAASFIFLTAFPFSNFVHAIGLLPGLLFIVFFSYLCSGLSKQRTQSMIAIVVLIVFVWLWGEAGRPGLVVMPVDLPQGRTDMNFTADGVANALETELEFFGREDTQEPLGKTEAAKILAYELGSQLFPQNPWYKGSDARPPGLTGLDASHIVTGTSVEGLPLTSIYHVLRHLRQEPLLEAQILLGEGGSLTLALRRLNAPLNCGSPLISEKLLSPLKLEQRGKAAIEELWDRTEEERNAIPRTVDNLGCFPSGMRRLLNWLDLVPLPSSAQERIANVTVRHLEGDVRLSVAIHLAALQAMEKLSPERMAQYYDNAGKYDSALFFYKEALPDLLRESHESRPFLEAFPRQRLANAFIRIGDFEYQLPNVCSASEDNPLAENSYGLADVIEPDDLSVMARIGYGYLVRAREIEWNSDNCETVKQSKEANRKAHELAESWKKTNHLIAGIEPRCQSSTEILCKSARALEAATGYRFTKADKSCTPKSTDIDELGLQRSKETLSWAYSNLAYVSGLLQTTDATNIAAVCDSDPDLRTVIANEYVRSLFPTAKCEGPTGRLEAAYLRNGNVFTLHNQILMEDQLHSAYLKLSQNCLNDSHRKADGPVNATTRKLGFDLALQAFKHEFLLDSLRALDYFETGSANPTKPLTNLRGLKSSQNYLKEKEPGEQLEYGTLLVLRIAFLKSEILGAQGVDDQAQLDQSQRDLNETLNYLSEAVREACSKNVVDIWNCSLAESLRARIMSLNCQATPTEVAQAEQAAIRFPDDSFVRANLGVVYLKRGDLEKALNVLQAAVRISRDDPSLRYLYNFALNANDKADEGRDQLVYGQALDLKNWTKMTQSFENVHLSTCGSTSRLKPQLVRVISN